MPPLFGEFQASLWPLPGDSRQHGPPENDPGESSGVRRNNNLRWRKQLPAECSEATAGAVREEGAVDCPRWGGTTNSTDTGCKRFGPPTALGALPRIAPPRCWDEELSQPE